MSVARKKLLEGFTKGAGEAVRSFFARSHEQSVTDIRRGGVPSVERAGLPYTLASHYGYDSLAEHLRIDQDLQARYTDYEDMDEYPEISVALDIYADDACAPNMDREQSIWVTSEDKAVADNLNDMLHKTLSVDDDVWGGARTLSKYGNNFSEVLVNERGVIGLNYLPPPTMRRVEDPKGGLLGFLQDVRGEFNITMDDFYALAAQRGGGPAPIAPVLNQRNRAPGELTVFEDWEVVHWRLRGKHLRSVYGFGVIDPARWVWKRLSLLEDALLIYKLERAPSRYAFYIDVGQLDAERGLAHVNRVKNSFTRKKFVNPSTGKLDMRNNPLPVAASTPVPQLDGRDITIEQMAREYEEGKKLWVYSVDRNTGHVMPGEVLWVGKTREKAKTIRVTFDDGNWAEMAPDHPVMRRDRNYVNAEDLQPGDRVMPLYRRGSEKAKGDSMEGYELVYDPEDQVSRYTHRVVMGGLGRHEPGMVVHHQDFNKRNNDPSNLRDMPLNEHLELHVSVGQSGGRAMVAKRKVDKELDARIRAACSRNITAYNQSPEKRARTTQLNREYDTARHIREYNASEQHKADNVIRSKAMKAMWADPKKAAWACGRMRVKFPEEFVQGVKALVRQNPSIRAEGVVQAVNEQLLDVLRSFGGTRNRKAVAHRHMMLKMYREQGFDSFSEFKSHVLSQPNNHRVVSVEVVESQDQYCMTVNRWHNFALLLRDGEGNGVWRSGVFVKNSFDEDFFVPVRDGKRTTEIDVLQGPDYTETDSLEYHRDKLVASLKIPKMYMGYGGEAVQGELSTQDIRFARTIMRIQQCLRGGYRKVCRVHLIASGQEQAVDKQYQVHMTVPSSILELARMEVMNTTADLAGRMGELVSTRWLLVHLFKFSEEEAVRVMQEKNEERLKDGAVEAQVQKLLQSMDDETVSGGAPPLSEGGQLEKRLSQMIRAVPKHDWRREFDRRDRIAEGRAEGKLDRLLKDNVAVNKRVRELGGLLVDLRKTMNAGVSP